MYCICIIYALYASRCVWRFLIYSSLSNYSACRIYCSNGPNDACHCDGYDKIKQYSFPIHAGVDGFSRKVLWLKVARSNKPYRSSVFVFKSDKRAGFISKSVKVRLWVWKWLYCCGKLFLDRDCITYIVYRMQTKE